MADEELQETHAELQSRSVTMNSLATHKELGFVLSVVN
jgi:hypothetical protein